MPTLKDLLRERFKPVPVVVDDPALAGKLFVRRMTMAELDRYMECVRAKAPERDQQKLLLSILVCDSDGRAVFDTPDECEILGDLWLSVYGVAAEIAFGANPGNSTPAKSRRGG